MSLLKSIRITGLILLTTVGFLVAATVGYCLLRGFSPFGLISDPPENNANTVVVYKTVQNRAMELIIYPPTRKLFRRSPVVFYLHGGSWKGGTHRLSGEELSDVVNPMRDFGMTVISVAYRLTDGQTKYPAHIEDVTDAIRYIVKHADDYGVDPNRLCTLGGSAGAHLALMAAMAEDQYSRNPAFSDVEYQIRCVVGIAAPLDFVDLSCYQGEDLILIQDLLTDFFGKTYEEDPDSYAAASPINHLDKGMPPVFLVHGEKDAVVPIIQADTFYEQGLQAGMDITYVRVINGNHGLNPTDGRKTIPDKKTVVREMVLFLLKRLLL